MIQFIVGFSSLLFSWWAAAAQPGTVKPDETVILFPTSGYMNAQELWEVPLHGWIFENEYDSLWRKATVRVLLNSLQMDTEVLNDRLFRERAWPFLVDNEGGKVIRVKLREKIVECAKSQSNGHFTGRAQLPPKDDLALTKPAWISYHVELNGGDQRRFEGEVQLLPIQGLSVISDIDDTIKHSHVEDKAALLRSTFLQEFQAVEGMAGIYRKWQAQGAAFHYLSASPWQLYSPLSEFIHERNFPKGDFYLRAFRIKDRSFYDLFVSPFDYKTKTIEGIFSRYPQRKFVLVGDSTESDPQVYAHIAKLYPSQVAKILIRNAARKSVRDFEQVFAGLNVELWRVFDQPAELAGVRLDAP